MAYITQTDLTGKIEARLINQALDDDGDGEADPGAWDRLYAAVEVAINGALAARYDVRAFRQPYPAAIVDFALTLAAEAIYARRGMTGDANPWKKPADMSRDRLEQIRIGKEFLSLDTQPADSGGMVVTVPSPLNSDPGRMMM